MHPRTHPRRHQLCGTQPLADRPRHRTGRAATPRDRCPHGRSSRGPGSRSVSNFSIVKPASVTNSGTLRTRWHPPATRCSMPSRRRCHAATRGSGDRPCSRKNNLPPGRSTRPISRSARAGSGTVHSVNVLTAASQLLSGRGSDCPSSPTKWTGIDDAAMRSAARRRAPRDGSTAATDVTALGYTGTLVPEPNPISTTSPLSPERARARKRCTWDASSTTSISRGSRRSDHKATVSGFRRRCGVCLLTASVPR